MMPTHWSLQIIDLKNKIADLEYIKLLYDNDTMLVLESKIQQFSLQMRVIIYDNIMKHENEGLYKQIIAVNEEIEQIKHEMLTTNNNGNISILKELIELIYSAMENLFDELELENNNEDEKEKEELDAIFIKMTNFFEETEDVEEEPQEEEEEAEA
jgi:hypothetical protein